MIRLLADENFDNGIIRALHRENADVDIIRVQDTEIHQAEDSRVLEWAATEGRILLTHDVRTMPLAASSSYTVWKAGFCLKPFRHLW